MKTNLLRIWILSLFVVFAFTGFAGYWSLNQIKHEAAQMLSRSVRESLIVKDYRSSIMLLSKNVPDLFEDISFVDTNNTSQFSVAKGKLPWLTLRILVPQYQDTERSVVFGTIIFSYSILGYLPYLIFMWLSEFTFLSALFLREKRILNHRLELQIERQRIVAQSTMAKKVAHDIRSPLSALSLIVGGLPPGDHRQIVTDVVARINGIADDLLNSERPNAMAGDAELRSSGVADLETLIMVILKEKSALYPEVKIQSSFTVRYIEWDGYDSDLGRIVSNLLNNSIESLGNQKLIQLVVHGSDSFVYIQVIDFGSGIPEEILAKIGKEKVSTKLNKGNGIGLSSAFEMIGLWGGEIDIKSRVDVGTQVTLKIPVGKFW